jgi:2-polyprenyl-6-methoxyphenol hydroxylase-like FAD-dependent oxidoreductase
MVVIVGGSIAGLVTALKLSAHNIPCVVIDRDVCPGEKACGEGLSSLGVTLLQELGFDWNTMSGHCANIDHYQLVTQSGEVFNLPVPGLTQDGCRALGVNRRVLERTLREFVSSRPGVELRLGESVKEVDCADAKFNIVTDSEIIAADFLVVASGGGSILRKERKKANLLGSTRWFAAQIEHNFSGIIAAPIPGGELFATRSAPDRINLSILSKDKAVARQWGEVVSIEALGAFVAPFGIRLLGEESRGGAGISVGRKDGIAFSEGVFSVGDAIEVLDPIGGMGMSHAILSASLAADAVSSCLHLGNSKSAATSQYLVERERKTRPLRQFTMVTRLLLRESSEGVRHGLLRLCSRLIPSFRLN